MKLVKMLFGPKVLALALFLATLQIAECGREVVNSRVGDDVEIRCPTIADTTFVNWYKDTKLLTEHPDLRIREKILRIKNVKFIDQGLYSCEAIGGFGSQPWKNFSLFIYAEDVSTFPDNPILETVTEKPIVVPRFMVDPPGLRESTHNVATSPKLRCRVQSNSAAIIDWYKDGILIDYRREDITKEGYSIKFNSLRMIDAGKYTCTVYNGHGSVNFTYTLTVTDTNVPTATVIVPYPQNTSVAYGSSASLQCKVRSYSRPTIMWLKQVPEQQDGVPHIILKDKIYTLIKNETMMVETEEGAYLNKLVLLNVKMKDAGVYVCLGLNQRGGSDFREALLTVIRPPVMTPTTLFPAATDNSWEYIFGSPSATLAVLIAIPVVIILIITIAIIYGLNKKKEKHWDTSSTTQQHDE